MDTSPDYALLSAFDEDAFARVQFNGVDLDLPAGTIVTMAHCLHVVEGRLVLYVENLHSDWMFERLKADGVFIDVGASTGAMTLPFALHYKQLEAYAFEPAKRASRLLRKTLERNGVSNVIVMHDAVSDTPGMTTFVEQPVDPTGAVPYLPETSALSVAGAPEAQRAVDTFQVPVTTLDALVKERGIHRREIVVKIDIEGFEAFALRGAVEMIAANTVHFAIDIHTSVEHEGDTAPDCEELLEPFGYTFERLGHVLLCSPTKVLSTVGRAPEDAAQPCADSAVDETAAAATGEGAQAAADAAKPSYEVLQGTPYSRYAVPIEYTPSRDYAPRWGYSRPPEPIVEAWFREYTDRYLAFVETMRSSAQNMRDIPLVFDEALLPSPAWGEVPYAPFDAVALYTMIVTHRPRRYLEIGSGISTCFAARAVRDAGLDTYITSIDPEPRAQVDAICNEVIRDGLETCNLELFDVLEPGDILFFDGSHRSFTNSDVTVFMLDVLPRLKPGVVIHVHDICIPYDYPPMFMNWYWNEQYLLHVYLMGNRHRVNPLLPTCFICKDPAFAASLDRPLIDIGKYNDGWRGGGAMWFTHTA